MRETPERSAYIPALGHAYSDSHLLIFVYSFISVPSKLLLLKLLRPNKHPLEFSSSLLEKQMRVTNIIRPKDEIFIASMLST